MLCSDARSEQKIAPDGKAISATLNRIKISSLRSISSASNAASQHSSLSPQAIGRTDFCQLIQPQAIRPATAAKTRLEQISAACVPASAGSAGQLRFSCAGDIRRRHAHAAVQHTTGSSAPTMSRTVIGHQIIAKIAAAIFSRDGRQYSANPAASAA